MPLDYRKDRRYSHLSQEQLRKHFEIENELREKILRSSLNERASVIMWAYDELFRRVPWHPALTETSGNEARALIQNRVRTLAPLLGKPPLRILEIGCGMGELMIGLAEEGYECVGIDVSEVRIERLKTHSTLHAAAFFRVEGSRLPFPDASFDVVVTMQLFEHLHPEDVPIHLQEVRRVLRNGGRYFLETPNKHVGPGDVSRFFVDGEPLGFHLEEYGISELVRLLRKNGYRPGGVVVWKSRRLSEKEAVLRERLWAFLPKQLRRKYTMGLHNPLYIAEKRIND